jgi:hypothetical protein
MKSTTHHQERTMTLSLTTIPADEFIAPGARMTADQRVGYVLVQTELGKGRVKDIGVYDAYSYVECVEDRGYALEAADGNVHYRIDALYECDGTINRIIC